MDYFLIVVLAILVYVVWLNGRSAESRLRDELARLDWEIQSLKAQSESLQRSLAAAEAGFAAEQSAVAASCPTEPRPKSHSQPMPAAAPPQPPATDVAAFQSAPSTAPKPPAMPAGTPASSGVAFLHVAQETARAAPPVTDSTPVGRLFSLEERLGANWLNKLGIAILVIGLAFFLAFRLETMGPAGKVLCGYAVSLALLAGGVWLERKATYRIFARAGIGGGWALAFFTTFALHHIPAARVISSLPADLVLMLLVAAGMVAHSLLYRSQTVTALAFLLGFITLLTSHLESGEGTVIFSLSASAILALALVVVTARRHYAWLELAGLGAVYLSHLVWLARAMPAEHVDFAQFWPSTALILFYWLIFRAAYVLRTPLDKEEEKISSLAAVLNSSGVLALLKYQSVHPEWAFWALAALGALEMALAFRVRARRRQAFIVLSTIATVLLVASVPFKFHGVSWPVLWLVEAQVLALCGLRLGEPVFRRLGLLTGLVTGLALAFHDVLPLLLRRLESPDPGHHTPLAAALTLAAGLYWVHSEVYPRRWPQIVAADMESFALRITSWLGLAAAATALWVVLPFSWVAAAWLALVLALGFIADWSHAENFAMQADLLAAAALMGLLAMNLWSGTGWQGHEEPLIAAVALLYAGMRRRTILAGSPNYVAPAYSWAATGLLAFVAAELTSFLYLTAVWAVLGLALFEIGRTARRGFLRWQGFCLVILAFARYFAIELPDTFGSFARLQQSSASTGHFSLVNSLLFTVLVLAAVGYSLLERTRDPARGPHAERIAGLAVDALGTLSIAVWFAFRWPSNWVPVAGAAAWTAAIWAAMATLLMTLAWLMGRRTFLVQAVTLAAAAVAHALVIDLDLFARPATLFWNSPIFHISLVALILLAALPFAFRVRGPAFWSDAAIQLPDAIAAAMRSPEQWFFFAPFALMVVGLAAKLSSGHITIAWSLLGLCVFLIALAVGERSYRLAGLALLLVSVVKILLVDVWALSAADRYTTLIVLGLALLAVSFLYTRFSGIIRRYL